MYGKLCSQGSPGEDCVRSCSYRLLASLLELRGNSEAFAGLADVLWRSPAQALARMQHAACSAAGRAVGLVVSMCLLIEVGKIPEDTASHLVQFVPKV